MKISRNYNIKNVFRRNILAISICLSGLTAFQCEATSISTQLDSMFGSMSNVTAPGDYQSVTRDGYTGGGFVLRNKLRTLTPISISLPSASGGCGGIDLFGGSFSFINADQFVQMLRNIASNAAGLAFQLALNAMDAVLDNAISKMQAIIQQMNDLTANSCQLAKGLLVDTASAFGDSAKAAVSSQLSSDGLSDQFKAMWGNMGGGKAPDVQKQEAGKRKACDDYGNIVWCLLQNGSFSNQFIGSEDEQKELIMSMTGTIIVGSQLGTDKDGSAKKSVVRIAPLATSNVLDSFINGDDSFDFWSCSGQTSTCENPKKQTKIIKGLAANITLFFIDNGYLSSARTGSNPGDAKLRQANYYNVAGATSKATQIARHDLAASYSYIRELSPVIAYSAAYNYLSEMLTAAATGARFQQENDKSASVYYKDAGELIEKARQNLYVSYNAMISRYGGEARIPESFSNYMTTLPQVHYESEGSLDGSL